MDQVTHRHHAPGRLLAPQVSIDGLFTLSGPMGRGGIARMGRAVVLAIDGVEIVVGEQPVQTLDPALLESVRIDPTARRIVALTSSIQVRAAFGPISAAVIEVEAGGLSSSSVNAFPFRRVRRPIAPLDREVRRLD